MQAYFSVSTLGSIVFDNVSQSIFSWDADPGLNSLYNDTNVDFQADGLFQDLDISINYATNRWSASYGSDSLFTNQEFHAGTSDLDYGSLAFTWELPADNTNPGDNYVAFDDILVETVIPEPSTYALIAGVVCLAGVLIRRRK